jgi:hypothetical protein
VLVSGFDICHGIPFLTGDSLLEFIKLIALSANDECEKDKKKTIAPEHVISAMEVSSIPTSQYLHVRLI